LHEGSSCKARVAFPIVLCAQQDFFTMQHLKHLPHGPCLQQKSCLHRNLLSAVHADQHVSAQLH